MTTPPEVEYRTIELTQGQICYVSPHRYDELMCFKWRALRRRKSNKFYAVRSGPRVGGRGDTIYMHREILGLKKGEKPQGDHKNRNSLDNTDINLRIPPTSGHNQMNQGVHCDSSTGLKGAWFSSQKQLYKSEIFVNGKAKHLGFYKTAYEAHLAYCYAAAFYFGEFACFE